MRKYNRIMVFGLPGSGKSYFSDRLSKITGLPLHHMDRYFFVSNWVDRDKKEFMQIQEEIVGQDEWIFDGNAMRTLETRFKRAEIVIYFNFSIPVCFYRCIRRIFRKDKHIKDLPDGCKKSLRGSLLRYLIVFKKKYKSKIEQLQSDYPKVTFLEFRKDQDAEEFLKEMQKED